MLAEEAGWSPGSTWPSTEGRARRRHGPHYHAVRWAPLGKVIIRRELEAKAGELGTLTGSCLWGWQMPPPEFSSVPCWPVPRCHGEWGSFGTSLEPKAALKPRVAN